MIINGTSLLESYPIKNMLRDKTKEHGVTHGLGEAGYDIRIKQEIRFERHRTGRRIEVRDPQGEIESIAMGRFVLASAIEEFDMPFDLVGVVHDKSTWARNGLSVFNTVIEPGWKGFLTLELVYHGESDLVIPAGAGIAQVMFHRTSDLGRYAGRYQHQADEPTPAKSST